MELTAPRPRRARSRRRGAQQRRGGRSDAGDLKNISSTFENTSSKASAAPPCLENATVPKTPPTPQSHHHSSPRHISPRHLPLRLHSPSRGRLPLRSEEHTSELQT